MSLYRACIVGFILGLSLYASFVLFYKKVNTTSIHQLQEDVRSSIGSKIGVLQSHQNAHNQVPVAPHGHAALEPVRNAQEPTTSVQTHTRQIPTEKTADLMSSFFAKPLPTVAAPAPNAVVPNSATQKSTREVCQGYVEKHGVVPGQSWGSLTIDLQRSWKVLNCDAQVRGAGDFVANEVEADTREVAAQKQIAMGSQAAGKPDTKEDGKKKKNKIPGIPSVSKDNKDWCNESKVKYNVVPMRSWGQLPLNYIEAWKSRKCDLVFTAERMGSRTLSYCPDLGNSTASGADKSMKADKKKSAAKKGGSEHSNFSPELPLIAIMAATTTRKINKPSTKNLSLFMYLLPSLIRTLDCGFRYEYVLGYDKGDPFYDSKEGMAEVLLWFKDNVENPMKKNGIKVTMRLVKVNNTLKKPGPVFLEMARAAYAAGAAYFYRINDDTELMVNWPSRFVSGMQAMTAPYGVIGPLCNQGNERILTHDFTCRLHMDIFEMNYYPPELTDWWMDDWISLVYGKQRTFKAKSVPVMHHTGTHGTRYTVDASNANRLVGLVESGRKKIRQWMLTNKVPEYEIKRFDTDEYKAFSHLDLATIMNKPS